MLSPLLTSFVLSMVTGLPAPQDPPPAGWFERNDGQFDARAQFCFRGAGHAVFVTADGPVLSLQHAGDQPPDRVALRFAGASKVTTARGIDRQSGIVNYFRGNDPGRWHTGVPTFARVEYDEVWPGIGVAYHSPAGRLEYDFIVAAGADPAQIRLRCDGAHRLRVAADGALIVDTAGGVLRHEAPFAYQEDGGRRVRVPAGFVVERDEVRFELGSYDHDRPLIIDPILVWSSYLGGSGFDQDPSLVVDAQGHPILFGYTTSTDFPTQNPIHGHKGSSDCFVTKFAPDGKTLIWSTYLGSSSAEEPGRITQLANGNLVVVGRAMGTDFPVLRGYQTTAPGGASGFVTVLSPAGTIVYSTYFRGTNGGLGIIATCVAPMGELIAVGGRGAPSDLPVTAGAFQATKPSLAAAAFIAVFDPRLSGPASLAACTFLTGTDNGTEIYAIATGPLGIYVTGQTSSVGFPVKDSIQSFQGMRDAFVTVLDAGLSNASFSTLLGGMRMENFGNAHIRTGIAVKQDGRIWITGDTQSTDFPITPDAIDQSGSFDAFLTLLDPAAAAGKKLVYSSYWGGAATEIGQDLVLDAQERVYLCGWSNSNDFQQRHSMSTHMPGGFADAFVSVFDPTGKQLLFSTLLGGNGYEQASGIALGADGAIHLCGTAGPNFPTTKGAFMELPKNTNASCWSAKIGVVFASEQNYGVGHPGKLGVPSLRMSAPPVLGTTPTIDLGSSTDATAPVGLFFGAQKASLPTPFDGTLLLIPIADWTLPLPPSGLSLPVQVPNDPGVSGATLLMQTVILDWGASKGLSFSRGLEIVAGI